MKGQGSDFVFPVNGKTRPVFLTVEGRAEAVDRQRPATTAGPDDPPATPLMH
jgi:hypothetical protein